METYTPDQLQAYLSHISFPTSNPSLVPGSLAHLAALQRHQLARVPFENVSLHYSPTRHLSLDPDELYTKIVDRSRGGYCMEVNTFFATVLRSLGYTLITAGARVKNKAENRLGGWNHQVSLVTVASQRYLVDVGFGASCPLEPIPLLDGYEWEGVFPHSRGRLEYRALAQHSDSAQRLWVYSARGGADEPWTELYAFTELEFFPEDYAVMNRTTATSPASFFTQMVVGMRTLLDESGEKTVGMVTLAKDRVKRRVGGKSEVLVSFKTEEDRVKALEEHFGIVLSASDRKGIKGLVSEIKG